MDEGDGTAEAAASAVAPSVAEGRSPKSSNFCSFCCFFTSAALCCLRALFFAESRPTFAAFRRTGLTYPRTSAGYKISCNWSLRRSAVNPDGSAQRLPTSYFRTSARPASLRSCRLSACVRAFSICSSAVSSNSSSLSWTIAASSAFASATSPRVALGLSAARLRAMSAKRPMASLSPSSSPSPVKPAEALAKASVALMSLSSSPAFTSRRLLA